MNTIEIIKRRIAKPATELVTGGFRPTNSMDESWIGRVYLYKEEEDIPKDSNGDFMMPLFQLCLTNLPFVPKAISGARALTVFVSKNLPMDLAVNGENWLIREYRPTDTLMVKNLTGKDSFLKPFPLRAQIIPDDYPVWDGGGLPEQTASKILALEHSGEIGDYYDMVENHYGHKIGGYPSFCQPGINFGNGFEFVMQIASDCKANLNIVDRGTIFLAKNAETGQWQYYCDFY